MQHRVRFRPRTEPLPPRAVLARGEVVERLVARLRERTPEELRKLEGVRGSGLIALLGATDALPWCDGVEYFGSDGNAHGLLFPVGLEPDVPVDWLAAAIGGSGRRLVLPHDAGLSILPLDLARPVALGVLDVSAQR